MVLFNYSTREVTAKVVYYGPGLCGKTTNLKFIYDSLPTGSKSKMLSLATNQDRTLFFDFLPLDLGTIKGMRVRLQLYTVPGQVYYNSTRQLVLKGSDGVIFVADSQDFALDGNLESWHNLKENLQVMGSHLKDYPHVVQYNKRDLPSILPSEELNTQINEFGAPWFEGIATTGYNVEVTLKALTKQVLTHLAAQYGLLPGEDISERDIVLFHRPEEPKRRRTTGGVMGFENENLDILWEKEEQKKDSFAFEGEEFEFQEVTAPAAAFTEIPPAAPDAPAPPAPMSVPSPAAEPFGDLASGPPIPQRPSVPIPYEPPSALRETVVSIPGPLFAPPPDLEPAPPLEVPVNTDMPSGGLELEPVPMPPVEISAPDPMPLDRPGTQAGLEPKPQLPVEIEYATGGLELEPVPMPEGPAPADIEMEPAPLSVEKLQQQIQAARLGQPLEKPAVPPAAQSPLTFGAREILIPVTLSALDLDLARKGELVIKLKVKIEP
jgi:hypothetical protein